MFKFKENYSLGKSYVYFAVTIIVFLILFYTWVGVMNYNKIMESHDSQLENQLNIIDSEIIQTFDYAYFVTAFIQNQLANNSLNEKKIVSLFKKLDHDYYSLNLPPISLFSWINNNKDLTVTSAHGQLKEDMVINLQHLKTLNQADKDNTQIFISEPIRRKLTPHWIISAVRSVRDKHNKLLGYIDIALNLDSFAKYFESKLDTSLVSYIIFSKNGNIIVQSSYNEFNIPHDYFKKQIIEKGAKPFMFNGIKYSIINESKKYPLIIAVGYYPDLLWHTIKSRMNIQLFSLLILCVVFILVLYEFKKKLFNPLFNLTKIADRISQGNLEDKIPEIKVIELQSLSFYLGKIKTYINDIVEVENRLLNAKVEAEKANSTKTQFLANVSHELRTPLFTVTGYAEAIKEGIYGETNPMIDEALDNIIYAGQHLLNLINDILDLSKAESGNMGLDEQYIKVKDNIERCIHFVEQMAFRKNINIVKNIDLNLPLLYADELRFRQIIINILSNSIKFCHHNGIVIISVFYDDKQERLFIKIRDNGIGVKKEDIPVIMSEFGQAKNAYSREQFQGTGLGLPLAVKFVKLQKGEFVFESEVGVGSEVTISFPHNRVRPAIIYNEHTEYAEI